MIKRLILLVLSLLLLVTFSSAEPERGVFADGTPFRTDVEGNQIVDYIAELENTIDQLNRKIYSLEIDLESKALQVDRYKSRRGSAKSAFDAPEQIKERSLIKEPAPPSVRPVVPVKQGDSGELRNEVEKCQTQLVDQDLELDSLRSERERLRDQLISMRTQLERAQITSSQITKDMEMLRSSYAGKIERSQQEIAALRSDVTGKQAAVSDLSEKLQQVNADAEEQARSLEQERARMTQGAETRTVVKVVREPAVPPQISNRRARAMQSARGMMKTELNQLKGVIRSRASLYSKHQKALDAGPVSFKLQKPVSKRGLSTNAISSRIENATQMSALSALRRDISQIRAVMQDDIGLIKRLAKVR